MLECRSCGEAMPESSRFCPQCGRPMVADGMVTRTEAVSTPSSHPSSSSSSMDEGRFLPGTLLAGRYRIVALLGRGGMGEVYRANDLKLGQPLFIPRNRSGTPWRFSMRERRGLEPGQAASAPCGSRRRRGAASRSILPSSARGRVRSHAAL